MDHIPAFLLSFLVTLALLWLLPPVARRIGFVDKPGGRKKHRGSIPLVGGVAMYAGTLTALWLTQESFEGFLGLLVGGGLLLLVGSIDDKLNLSAASRFVAQISAVFIAIYFDQLMLNHLGNLVGLGQLQLGWMALPVTVIAVVGVINALNMSDGMDGLAGGLSLVTLASLTLVALYFGHFEQAFLLPVLTGAVLAFLTRNMRTRRHKQASVFMGDGGSMFLGFTIAWLVIQASQNPASGFAPVNALWIFALPLLDTVCIMLRRILKGRSPFAPDREHFHHILLVAGYSVRRSVLIMLALAGLLASAGLLAQALGVPESWQFAAFLALFGAYSWGMSHAWKVMKAIRPASPPSAGGSDNFIHPVKRSRR